MPGPMRPTRTTKSKKIKIEKILTTCLENYYPLIAEKGIIIREEVEDFTVFYDENVLVFIISQILVQCYQVYGK
jgi:hypothetical protein